MRWHLPVTGLLLASALAACGGGQASTTSSAPAQASSAASVPAKAAPSSGASAPASGPAKASTSGQSGAASSAPTSGLGSGRSSAASSAPAGGSASGQSGAASAAAVGGSAAAGSSTAGGALIKVKAAYPQASVTQGALFVAVDEGIFKKNGLDVSIEMVKPTTQVPALINGELQFGGVGANEVADADLGGASVVMIATAVDYPFFSLYANKKYTSMNDLAGQTIGVTSIGASTDAAARLFLQHFGLLDKVKIIAAGGTQPSILAAMSSGNIAGGILAPPTTDKAAAAGFVELVNGVALGVPMNTNGTVVTRAYEKDHPDVVKRFLQAYQQAWTYNANPANQATVVKVLAKYTKSSEAGATAGYKAMLKVWQASKTPTVNPAAVKNLLKLSTNPKAQNADPAQFIDNSILQSIQ